MSVPNVTAVIAVSAIFLRGLPVIAINRLNVHNSFAESSGVNKDSVDIPSGFLYMEVEHTRRNLEGNPMDLRRTCEETVVKPEESAKKCEESAKKREGITKKLGEIRNSNWPVPFYEYLSILSLSSTVFA